jgi:hypothetical protein
MCQIDKWDHAIEAVFLLVLLYMLGGAIKWLADTK